MMRFRFSQAWPLLLAALGSAPASAQWLQWGGPQRDFATPNTTDLADRWPDAGPKQLWKQPIEHAHSSILVDGDVLYTMTRRGEQDAALALKSDSGRTVWETRYDAPMKPDMALEFGPGPHATPAAAGDRLFTVSTTVLLHALDKKTGKILWSKDLMSELGASHAGRGYAVSPLPYQDLLILNIGSAETGLAALRQDTGALVWKSESLRPGHSSPILARINNEDHVIVAYGTVRAGFDPLTGKTRWKHEVDQQQAALMTTPLFIAPDRLFFTAAYGGGTMLLKVSPQGGGYGAEQLWHTGKMRVHHADVVRAGDVVYGSSGDFGPALLMAIQLDDGKVLWRERGFAKANLLWADGKLIILDEDGVLALARPKPDGLEVLAQAKLLENKAWTCPTLIGTKLYLRDYKTIMALDLGKAAN